MEPMSEFIDLLPWSRQDVHLAHQPYPFGWVDGFVPEQEYKALLDSFVSPDSHPAASVLGRGKKRVMFSMPPLPDNLGPLPSPWQNLLTTLSRGDVIKQAFDWARHLTDAQEMPSAEYKELISLRNDLSTDDLIWQCEFSSMEQGVLLPPHSDSIDKILIFVWYFTPPGWVAEWGGDTEVYAAKDPAQNLNWSNFFLRHDQVAIVESSKYVANRLFFFAKTPAAWHGVSPVSTAATLPRLSFNFSLRIKPDASLPLRLVELMEQVKRKESVAFAP